MLRKGAGARLRERSRCFIGRSTTSVTDKLSQPPLDADLAEPSPNANGEPAGEAEQLPARFIGYPLCSTHRGRFSRSPDPPLSMPRLLGDHRGEAIKCAAVGSLAPFRSIVVATLIRSFEAAKNEEGRARSGRSGSLAEQGRARRFAS